MRTIKIFKTRWFHRFAVKELIEDSVLIDAIGRAEKGLIDADLGGGVIKQRIARPGRGKSGGYRAVIIFRVEDRAVFMYGFAKSERDNIRADEEKAFKEAAKHLLALTDNVLSELVKRGDLVEVKART
jgi:hypothetical protein